MGVRGGRWIMSKWWRVRMPGDHWRSRNGRGLSTLQKEPKGCIAEWNEAEGTERNKVEEESE